MDNSGVTSLYLEIPRERKQFFHLQLLKIPGKGSDWSQYESQSNPKWSDWSSLGHSPSPRHLIGPAWATIQTRDLTALTGSSPKVTWINQGRTVL